MTLEQSLSKLSQQQIVVVFGAIFAATASQECVMPRKKIGL
jgi:hypothetical protein